ncbi:MAG: DUF5050 domain-containing protein [bacterium]|nr:DUF5050 domain-containing protein [bacterium]
MRILTIVLFILIFFACSDNGIEPGDIDNMDPNARIMFVSDRSGSEKVYIMKPNGEDLNPLSDMQIFTSGYYTRPRLSPDRSKVLFNAEGDLWVVGIDGTNLTRLTDTPDNATIYQRWSPDGTKIVYTMLGTIGEYSYDIFVMNADGTNKTNITTNDHPDFRPIWSNDGTKIIYHTDIFNDEEGGWDLCMVNSDGTGYRIIYEGTLEDMAHGHSDWCSSYDKFLFTAGSLQEDGIYEYNMVTESYNLIIEYASGGIYSPDGSKIVYFSDQSCRKEIWVADSDGMNRLLLTENMGDVRRPIWSLDGDKITFSSNKDGNFDLYMINPDGTDLQKITTDEGDDFLAVLFNIY